MLKKKFKKENGITLIALILTVIIMIIMAGITFNALVGDNGILGNVMDAKIKHEDEGAKEELQLAWSARMSKFYEAVSKGEASFDDIGSYFSKEELNQMLGNGGRLTGISYNPTTKEFDISYRSASNVDYIGKIKPSGEITKLERATTSIEYTDVWANYFEAEGKLTYTTVKDTAATISWNITKPIYRYEDVPWYYDETQGKSVTTYTNQITKVEVAEDVIPESTQFMFYYLQNVKDIDIIGLDSLLTRVSEIGAYMFYNCKKMTFENMVISDSVTSIRNYAFYECKSLTSITIPDSVTSIGDYAFYYCQALTSITIPDSVTSIGDYAFRVCSSLKSVMLSDSLMTIGLSAFYKCTALTSITIPNSVTSIGSAAFRKCTALKSITLSDSLMTIGNSAFFECTALTSITIPNSVISIGEYAFRVCSSLKSVMLSDSLMTIGWSAFFGCTALTSITIPNNVTSIENYAFYYCTTLTSIVIPESVTTIGEKAFYNCTNLTSIKIKKANGSISGAPWGATSATVVWEP